MNATYVSCHWLCIGFGSQADEEIGGSSVSRKGLAMHFSAESDGRCFCFARGGAARGSRARGVVPHVPILARAFIAVRSPLPRCWDKGPVSRKGEAGGAGETRSPDGRCQARGAAGVECACEQRRRCRGKQVPTSCTLSARRRRRLEETNRLTRRKLHMHVWMGMLKTALLRFFFAGKGFGRSVNAAAYIHVPNYIACTIGQNPGVDGCCCCCFVGLDLGSSDFRVLQLQNIDCQGWGGMYIYRT